MTIQGKRAICVLAISIAAVGANACARSSQGDRVRDARWGQVEARAAAEQQALDCWQRAQDEALAQPYAERKEAVAVVARMGKHADESPVAWARACAAVLCSPCDQGRQCR